MVLNDGPDHADVRRWRKVLQRRYAAGEEYDALTRAEREMFNALAADFIGTPSELVQCVMAISRGVTPPPQSP